MTATEVPTIQTESSPPYAPSSAPRRRRRVLLGAALAVLAAVALIAWLLAMSSDPTFISFRDRGVKGAFG
jgi:ferric-dicitrate binding protein FerR (iron transport regulator)